MFFRHFWPFFRARHTAWVTFSARFRNFSSADGPVNRCSLKGVATLLPVFLFRSVHCKPKEVEDKESSSKRAARKRNVTKVKFEMRLESKAQHYLNSLKVRWEQLHSIPGLFSYQLQKAPEIRRLPGSHGFITELNTERSTNRRYPQTIENLNPTFKTTLFNFNKVDPLEVMMTIDDAEGSPEVQMIINKSPLTKYHTLICPEVEKNHIQRLNLEALQFCVTFMRNIDDDSMRMGYNSPGALASVNHLHFHLIHLPHTLYVDRVALEKLTGNYVYRLGRRAPTEGLCFVFANKDTDEEVADKVDKLYQIAMWMCKFNMPHNLFITQDRRPGKEGDVLVFLFARSEFCVSKDLADFNVGFCELAGFIPMPDRDKMKDITEAEVLQRIRTVTGDAHKSVYVEMKRIVEGCEDDLEDNPFLV
ncbi:hypothetical protein KR018_004203 [Drosophila ironensis]|nr:hypothetical protein KR018_004203 [Drosophila ironensis]